ncbi:MAG: NEAT domain-containing protein [Firmicutes bacterium]|nr:NEAT domain-containing protein [Bacillota bacterium]
MFRKFLTIIFAALIMTAPVYANEKYENTEKNGIIFNSDTLEDGNYYVPVQLWHAYANQESMGNTAFKENPNALVKVKDGTASIDIATNPVKVTVFYSAMENLRYTGKDGNTTYAKPIQKDTVTAYGYENDSAMQFYELEYLRIFEISVPADKSEYTAVEIKTPYTPMQLTGEWMEARLKFDWTSVVKTNDTSLTPNPISPENTTQTTSSTTETTTESTTQTTTETASEETTENAIVYSVPVEMVQAANPSVMSMGDDALDGNAVVTIKGGRAYVDINFKAVVKTGIYGHLLKMWSYPSSDKMNYDRWGDPTYEIPAEVIAVYNDYGMKYPSGDTTLSEFVKTVRIERDTLKEDHIYIRVQVDAMDGFDQAARINFDWDNAAEKQKYTYGDVNCDGKVTETDTISVLQNVLSDSFALQIQNETADWLQYADVDLDKNVTANDAALIYKKASDSTFILPCENK